jgi:protein-S-isoprenylcysteine O-methyltransferase Ste14
MAASTMAASTMGASAFEYRFRYAIHTMLFFVAFLAPWIWLAPKYFSRESTWLVLTNALASAGWLRFQAATVVLLVVATICAVLGAWLRTWGTAYLSASVVQSGAMHDQGVIADGPFRYMRNPLYLGTFFITVALTLLMPPTGALFAIVTLGIFQLRLIFAEEPFLAAKLGAPYKEYCARVPRILPVATPQVPASGRKPHWGQAALGEILFIGIALSYAIFGWRYNAFLLEKCVLISLGVSLVVRALLPRVTAE